MRKQMVIIILINIVRKLDDLKKRLYELFESALVRVGTDENALN